MGLTQPLEIVHTIQLAIARIGQLEMTVRWQRIGLVLMNVLLVVGASTFMWSATSAANCNARGTLVPFLQNQTTAPLWRRLPSVSLQCQCPDGWSGPSCAIFEQHQTCNGHRMISYANQLGFTCECSSGYVGDRCEFTYVGKFFKGAAKIGYLAGAAAGCAAACATQIPLYAWLGPLSPVVAGPMSIACMVGCSGGAVIVGEIPNHM